MNTEDITLPELSDHRRDEIEAALFAQIAQERSSAADVAERTRASSARRGRVWMGAAGAAAVVAVAAIIAPSLLSGMSAGSADSATVQPGFTSSADGGIVGAESLTDQAGGAAGSVIESGGSASQAQPDAGEREIVATASATVRVDDVRTAATDIAAAAAAVGGYVESMSIGGTTIPIDDMTGGMSYDQIAPVDPSAPSVAGAWVTVRIPAEQLTAALADLASVGEVTASQLDRRDVTTESVDLRARVAALEASVARMTELMAQATSTADLIAAEAALSQRQSDLDSLRQQLTWLETQVGMSTLTVTLTEASPAVSADPAGFGDGLAAGWNGLVATLNGVVVALGFLLPWLVVIAVGALAVWAARRAIHRRRASVSVDSEQMVDPAD